MTAERDKGGGNVDWETHSLRYVVNAISSAQKRQQKLWNKLAASRTKKGIIPINWPLIEEYVESVRRTHSMMIDLETVGSEYDAKFTRARRKKAAKKSARKPARKAAKKTRGAGKKK